LNDELWRDVAAFVLNFFARAKIFGFSGGE
jgi:hypothetical protein